MADLEKIANEAARLVAAVVQSGGMATKSFTDEWVMKHYGLSRVAARGISNDLEFYQIRHNGPVDLSEYPDVKLERAVKQAVVTG